MKVLFRYCKVDEDWFWNSSFISCGVPGVFCLGYSIKISLTKNFRIMNRPTYTGETVLKSMRFLHRSLMLRSSLLWKLAFTKNKGHNFILRIDSTKKFVLTHWPIPLRWLRERFRFNLGLAGHKHRLVVLQHFIPEVWLIYYVHWSLIWSFAKLIHRRFISLQSSRCWFSSIATRLVSGWVIYLFRFK